MLGHEPIGPDSEVQFLPGLVNFIGKPLAGEVTS
jgi:hypothetical protein